jgi:hypothetical protein
LPAAVHLETVNPTGKLTHVAQSDGLHKDLKRMF